MNGQDMDWRRARSADIAQQLVETTGVKPRKRVAAQLGENLCDSCGNSRCPLENRTALSCVEFRGKGI